MASVPKARQAVKDKAELRVHCENELRSYLASDGLNVSKEDGSWENPLDWWKLKERQDKYPILCKLAKAFLAIPATSAPSERIWSRSSKVLTDEASRLDPLYVSCEMFLKENEWILNKYYGPMTEKMKNAPPLFVPDWIEDEAAVDVCADVIMKDF